MCYQQNGGVVRSRVMPFLTIARSSTAGRRGGPSSAGIAAPFESGSSLHSATRAELLWMWRQSGGRLRQFGQKSRVSRRIAFIGVWAFWKHLDLGAADPDAERRNGNNNIHVNRVIQGAPTARARGH